jgi:hypothetical protein
MKTKNNMKKKQLLEDIQRMKTIMGLDPINKISITEAAVYAPPFGRIIKYLVNVVGENFSTGVKTLVINGVENVEILGNFLPKMEWDDMLKKFFKKTYQGVEWRYFTPLQKEFFKNLIRESGQMDQLYLDWITNMGVKIGQQLNRRVDEKEILNEIQSIWDSLPPGATPEDLFQNLNGGVYDDFWPDMVGPQLFVRLESKSSDDFVDLIPKPKVPKKVVQHIEKSVKAAKDITPEDVSDPSAFVKLFTQSLSAFNTVRPSIFLLMNRFVLRMQKIYDPEALQLYVDRLVKGLDDMERNLKSPKEIDKDLKSLSLQFRSISNAYKSTYDEFMKELFETMEKEMAGSFKKETIEKCKETMKKVDPFGEISVYESKSKSDLWNAWKETSTSVAWDEAKYFLSGHFKSLGYLMKKLFGKIGEENFIPKLDRYINNLGERILVFLGTGAPKTFDEIKVFTKMGPKGTWKLVKYMWIAHHVGLPLTISLFKAFGAALMILTHFNMEKFSGAIEAISINFKEQVSESFHWNDIMNILKGAPREESVLSTLFFGPLSIGSIYFVDALQLLDKPFTGEAGEGYIDRFIDWWSKNIAPIFPWFDERVDEIEKTSKDAIKKGEEILKDNFPGSDTSKVTEIVIDSTSADEAEKKMSEMNPQEAYESEYGSSETSAKKALGINFYCYSEIGGYAFDTSGKGYYFDGNTKQWVRQPRVDGQQNKYCEQ